MYYIKHVIGAHSKTFPKLLPSPLTLKCHHTYSSFSVSSSIRFFAYGAHRSLLFRSVCSHCGSADSGGGL